MTARHHLTARRALAERSARRVLRQGLNALKPVCTQSRERTAEIVWVTLQALDQVGSGLSRQTRPTDCAALLAAYATLAETPGHTP